MSFLDFPDDDPRRRNRRPLLLFVIAALAVGAAGSVFAAPAIPTWYAALAHPSFAPPDWLFAPVWTALYVLIAVAAWLVWRIVGLKSAEIAAWAAQLALNFAWCAIFFGLHRIGLALIEIVLLELAVLVTTILFGRRDRLAGLLMLPALVWTGFAVALNYGFWALNG